MNEVIVLLAEWEAEILQLEQLLWQVKGPAMRAVPRREQHRLELRLRVARHSQRLLYGLTTLVA